MKIDLNLIITISNLSKIRLNQIDIEKYQKDFKEILEAFAILKEVNVRNVKSSFRPIEQKNVLREDITKKSLGQKAALKFTKHKEKGFFVGPKTVE